MALRDIGYVAGKTLLGLGTPARRGASPFETGLSTAIATIPGAIDFRRNRQAQQSDLAMRQTIESRIGVPYDFFLKLSDEAQQDILRNAGIVGAQPGIEAFGGRTLTQLETEGAPAREGTVPGGSGVFLGLPDAAVQTGPPLPPLKALSPQGRDVAVNRYLGLGEDGGVSPQDQSQIDYRTARIGQLERGLKSQLETDKARRGQIAASTEALKALRVNRESQDAAVPAYMLDVARQMGVIVPRGVSSMNRKDFDTLVSKFPKPVMAVVGRISDLAYAAREAEIARGVSLTDKEIENAVRQGTIGLEAQAGPEAIGIVVQGVKRELLNLRAIPGLIAREGRSEPEDADEDQDGIPDLLEDDEEDFEEEEDDLNVR